MARLIIANKKYSSWSLRPWLLMKHLKLAFDEVVIPLRQEDTTKRIKEFAPSGRVPALIDGGLTIWDSAAIIEYLNEKHPELSIWPKSNAARAEARSVSAEMHSGFQALRNQCPMIVTKRFEPRDKGPEVVADIARVERIFCGARAKFGAGGPFLFGEFSAADAMFAPVATRLKTYSIPVSQVTGAYIDTILALPAFQAWLKGAIAEPWDIPAYGEGETIVEDLTAKA